MLSQIGEIHCLLITVFEFKLKDIDRFFIHITISFVFKISVFNEI